MIKLVKSTFYREEETKNKLVDYIQTSVKLSMGSECEKFEENFSKYQNRNHTCFVNSGSSANILLLQALINLKKIKKGDDIAFSSLTWSTNVMPIIQLGLNPVPIDVSLTNLNICFDNNKQAHDFKIKPSFKILRLLSFKVFPVEVISVIISEEPIKG